MSHNNKSYLYGKLNVGEVSGVPLINNLNHLSLEDDIVITDCPPGVSCNTVSALENSDYAIICAEPTPFGVSDMKMVVELLRAEKIPFGVVINKSGLGNNDIYNYLEKEKIKLIEEIPWTKERAVLYSEGKIMINHDNILREKIRNITTQVIGDLNDK